MSQSKPNIIHELKVNKLPSLPHVLTEMLRACESNQASFQELAQIINKDSVIAGRVIFLANSSFYNPGTKVQTLERALFLLGTDTLKSIVITASIQQFFSSFKSARSGFLQSFWQRSLSCALLTKSLAILTSYPNPDEAYLTGLLHNIGELVLESNHPGFYSKNDQALTDWAQVQHEKKQFNFTHTQVGACLAKEWGLSPFTCDAIEFHHAPLELIDDAHHLVKLIYLGSYLSHPQKQYLEANDEIAHQLFELNAALVNEIVLKIESEVAEISHSLGIETASASIEQIQRNHEQAQLSLAKQVRNIGLIQNAMSDLNRATSLDELVGALQNALTWLYGFEQSLIFWFSEQDQQLSLHPIKEDETETLRIKLASSSSLISQAAKLKKRLTADAEDSNLKVLDTQILNLLRASSSVYLPVFDEHGLICVIAAGTMANFGEQTHTHEFLAFFAQETAPVCRRVLANANNNALLSAESTGITFNKEALNNRLDEVLHEANNPLSIISNYLHALGQKFASNETLNSTEVSEELTILREEVQRTSQILLQLKDVSSTENTSEEGVDINHEIEGLCKIYNHSLFALKQINTDLTLDRSLPRLHLNRNALKQILTNLIRNATEALPINGRIQIKTNAQVNVNGRDYVALSIQDNGPGIPKELLKSLFTPVVSTKGKGHSGLGLSITKNLVKDAKGTISCRSSDQGTVFEILLPKVPAP